MRTSPTAIVSVAACVFGFALLAACHDTTGPRTGSIAVLVVVTGATQDTNVRYELRVDGGSPTLLRPPQIVTVSDLSPGEHRLELTSSVPYCPVAGTNPRTVQVNAGQQSVEQFSISCVPNVGHVRVTTVSTGQALDPDGYRVLVQQADRGAIGVNAAITFDLPVGTYTIQLGSIARNC